MTRNRFGPIRAGRSARQPTEPPAREVAKASGIIVSIHDLKEDLRLGGREHGDVGVRPQGLGKSQSRGAMLRRAMFNILPSN